MGIFSEPGCGNQHIIFPTEIPQQHLTLKKEPKNISENWQEIARIKLQIYVCNENACQNHQWETNGH